MARRAVPVLALALLACVARPAIAQTAASGPRPSRPVELRLGVPIDIGVSGSDLPQNLAEGWQSGFQPNNQGMTTGRSDHAFFMNAGVELEAVIPLGSGWRLGIPVVLPVGGMARAAGARTVFYFIRQPVAGTRVDWWDPVLVHATAVKWTTPAAGLSVHRGRFALRATVHRVSTLAEDFVGKDCVDCKNSSSVSNTVELESGPGFRIDLVKLPADFGGPSASPAAWGLFVERDVAHAWQAGVSLRLVFRLGKRS